MAFTEIAIRLAVAALCGGLIGFEREHQQKPAGLRTHMLVAIGSAAFTLAMLELNQTPGMNSNQSNVQMDPTRIIQGIAGGIGFLGAGAILRTRGSVRGLTTAATIWVVGAVGICCGLGNYVLAATTSVLALLIASLLGVVETWLFSHRPDSNSHSSQDGHSGDKTSSEMATDEAGENSPKEDKMNDRT